MLKILSGMIILLYLYQLLFLMNYTPVLQVKEVADQGLTMPHKSTFFYPKILTGLLINRINPDEGVKLP